MLNKSSLKTLLLLSLCLLILTCGCSMISESSSLASSSTVSQETSSSSFDALTRKIFVDYANHDTLSLNYTLKDPMAYDIHSEEITWGDVSVTSEDFEACKNKTSEYLDELNSITELNSSQTLTYDVLKYYLELELEGYDYIYFSNNFAPMLGIQSQLPITLAEYPFDDITDVEAYIELLGKTDDYIHDLLAFETAKAEAGFGMCCSALEASIEDCYAFLESGDSNMLIEIFQDKLEPLRLPDDQKHTYIQSHTNAVLNHVLPAYEQIISALSDQLETAPENGSLASYENGQAYYEYLLKASVGTDKTASELITMTEKNLKDSMMELSLISLNNTSIDDDLCTQAYPLSDPKKILEHFKNTLTVEQFPTAPFVSYTLKNVHASLSERLSPAMYLVPRIDEFTNNQIYLNIDEKNSGNALMPTLAHEGYPGHMYQMTYYYNTRPNPVRTVYQCNGYVEGWASYVESLSYDYCGFSKDVAAFNRISNLTMALNLYCRLDLGIHYENWTFKETSAFIHQYLSIDNDTVSQIYEAILFNPTNYLIYGIGMEEIIELRENAENNLGSDFLLKDFHKQLLDLGPAPFPIIKKYMPESVSPAKEITENAA